MLVTVLSAFIKYLISVVLLQPITICSCLLIFILYNIIIVLLEVLSRKLLITERGFYSLQENLRAIYSPFHDALK